MQESSRGQSKRFPEAVEEFAQVNFMSKRQNALRGVQPASLKNAPFEMFGFRGVQPASLKNAPFEMCGPAPPRYNVERFLSLNPFKQRTSTSELDPTLC